MMEGLKVVAERHSKWNLMAAEEKCQVATPQPVEKMDNRHIAVAYSVFSR